MPQVLVFKQEIDNLESVFYRLYNIQWEGNPALQHSRSHWRRSLVQYIEKRHAFVGRCSVQFKVTHCESVQPHEPVLVYARERRDVRYMLMMRMVEVVKNSTRGYDTGFQ